MKEFLNIKEVSDQFCLKKSTLYAKVSSREIPHYKIGRLVLFKSDDLHKWFEGQKRFVHDTDVQVKQCIDQVKNKAVDLDKIVKKSIEQTLSPLYNLSHRETRSKSLKGGHNGTI